MAEELCMFCGDQIPAGQLTMEHFVPKGLWEKGYRPNKMKTLPAHQACNQSFSGDNEYFRDVLVMENGVQQHRRHSTSVAPRLRRSVALDAAGRRRNGSRGPSNTPARPARQTDR